MTTLSRLDEKVMLEVLEKRFFIDKIYTWTGRILLAVNPYKKIDIYGMTQNNNSPHIYSIAESALKDLKSGQSKQISILISGESGAGKTESAKYIMRYFSYYGKSNNSIEDKVLASNPILEAFGNAQTTQNHNSSRFGKYIKIYFDPSYNILGAEIQTFLLEKVRVITFGKGERNFHIWYQILSEYQISDKFKYLSEDNSIKADFSETKKAFQYFGINSHNVATLLLGILYLGNISFDEQGKILNNKPLTKVSEYWKLPLEVLKTLLTFRKIKAGREVIQVKMKQEECSQRRDTLAKSLYSSLFDWIVSKINAHLVPKNKSDISIGILDIFGFENFQKNAFEQLCINFTNEILQQVFQNFVFEQEQKEYNKEEIDWQDITFPTNDNIISLIDKQIFKKLDEECSLTKPSHSKLIRSIEGISNPNVSVSKMQKAKGIFQISHYAGPVEYGQSLIEKNLDLQHPEQSSYVENSNHDIISTFIFKVHRKVKTDSVSKQFRQNIQDLRKIIFETKPYFVRCIKPNTQAVPGSVDAYLISKQLGYCGILEATKISRAGFPARFEHQVFLDKYNNLIGNLNYFLKHNKNIRKGKTKFYLKYEAFLLLEIATNLRKKYSVNKIIKNFRRWNLKRKKDAISKIMHFYRNIRIIYFIKILVKKSVAAKKIVKFYWGVKTLQSIKNIGRKSQACKKINLIINKNIQQIYFSKFNQLLKIKKKNRLFILDFIDNLIDNTINQQVELEAEKIKKLMVNKIKAAEKIKKQINQKLKTDIPKVELIPLEANQVKKNIAEKGELLLMQTQYQQISCVQDQVDKLSNVKTKVEKIEKEVNSQMDSVKQRVKNELMQQVKDMELIKKEVKQLQLIKNGLQQELGQLSAIRQELSSLKSFQEDVKKIKENAINTSRDLDQVGVSANIFKNSVNNILVKMKVSEDQIKESVSEQRKEIKTDEISDLALTKIYNKMKKQEEKNDSKNLMLKVGGFFLLCLNSIVLVAVFKRFGKN